MRILLIEDETKIASFIERGLKEEHYIVDVAYRGEEALHMVDSSPYDLVILDLMLPDKDGFTVCSEMRGKEKETPILILTAKDSLHDKVFGLDQGADDYLTKPFAFEELLARVRALLRRKRADKSTIRRVADLELDQVTHKVSRGGREIQLTSKEYNLLEYLMLNASHVVTRTMISEHVWNEDFDSFTNITDVYINYLRKKIEKGFDRQLIHTIRGTGYIIKE